MTSRIVHTIRQLRARDQLKIYIIVLKPINADAH
jgi:hypothetical protein